MQSHEAGAMKTKLFPWRNWYVRCTCIDLAQNKNVSVNQAQIDVKWVC